MLHLEIVSPEGIIFKEEVDEVSLPTPLGEITLLPHHAPLFTKVSDGEVKVKKNNKNIFFAVSGGFLEVSNNSVSLLSDYAVQAENIQIAKAEEAKNRAKKTLEEQREREDFVLIEKNLQRSILELKVAEKVRKRNQGNL